LGFDCVWAAEAYGSDAATVLAAVAARTHRIGVGSAVLQIPGRTPAMTAMTAATLDAISQGLFTLGLGVSGPQVSEGWHGVKFADPIGRTEEYVQIVRQAVSRRRVTAGGQHFTLPLPGGEGKSLVLALQPVRPEIPIYLAAIGPKNLDLTGRIEAFRDRGLLYQTGADEYFAPTSWLAVLYGQNIRPQGHNPLHDLSDPAPAAAGLKRIADRWREVAAAMPAHDDLLKSRQMWSG
jgi:hypothetical protein